MVKAQQAKKPASTTTGSAAEARRCDSSPASLASNHTPTENSMTAENDSINSICIDRCPGAAGKSTTPATSHLQLATPTSSPENPVLNDVIRSYSTPPLPGDGGHAKAASDDGEEETPSESEDDDLLGPLHDGPLSPKAVGRPATQGTTASTDEDERKLPSEWTIWFDKSSPEGEDTKKRVDDMDKPASSFYDGCIVELASFDSVRGFWEYWNTLRVENLKTHCNLRIFRKGIKPLQEDPKNSSGGKWVVRGVPTATRKTMWTDMALVLISEKIQDYTTNTVCGAVLSTRDVGDSLQIWVDGNTAPSSPTAAASSTGRPHIALALKRMFFPHSHEPYSTFIYQTHQELHPMGPAAAAAKAKDGATTAGGPTTSSSSSSGNPPHIAADDSNFDMLGLASPTERSRRHVLDDGSCIRMAYPTPAQPTPQRRPRSESASAVEGLPSSVGTKASITPATRELLARQYPGMKPLSLDFTAEVPSSAHSTPHKDTALTPSSSAAAAHHAIGACTPTTQSLLASKQKGLQPLLQQPPAGPKDTLSAAAMPYPHPTPSKAQAPLAKPSQDAAGAAQLNPIVQPGQQQQQQYYKQPLQQQQQQHPQFAPQQPYYGQAPHATASGGSYPNRPMMQPSQGNVPFVGPMGQQQMHMPQSMNLNSIAPNYMQQQQQQQQQQMNQLYGQQQQQQPQQQMGGYGNMHMGMQMPQQQQHQQMAPHGILPPDLPQPQQQLMQSNSWQGVPQINYQNMKGMSPALQAHILQQQQPMSRPLSREVSGLTTDTTPSYSQSGDGDEESAFQDDDLPEDLRVIQDRAKSIRTLKKKIRYISFFLQRQCKGRELTASEKQRINSLPLLQQELKVLDQQQQLEIEVQRQVNHIDCDEFLKKPQQCMTYSSESERRFKTMRALRKKIRFIHYHVERQKQGKSLSPAEQAKVLSLPALEAKLAQLEAEEAAWQQQNGGRRWNKHAKEAAAAAEKSSESDDMSEHHDTSAVPPSSYMPSAPTEGSVPAPKNWQQGQPPQFAPPTGAIETLHSQITAQRRQLEEKQRRIETLIKSRQGGGSGSPSAMSPGQTFPSAANLMPSYYFSPGGQSCGASSPNGGPPPLGSPMMSPPMSPNYTLGRY